nr:atherin-like [Aegilops tauschii subsp. strangulata]
MRIARAVAGPCCCSTSPARPPPWLSAPAPELATTAAARTCCCPGAAASPRRAWAVHPAHAPWSCSGATATTRPPPCVVRGRPHACPLHSPRPVPVVPHLRLPLYCARTSAPSRPSPARTCCHGRTRPAPRVPAPDAPARRRPTSAAATPLRVCSHAHPRVARLSH